VPRLRDVEAFDEWARRPDVLHSDWVRVRAWINGLKELSWQAPSVPVPDLSDLPASEVRQAIVPGTEVIVVYKVHLSDESLDAEVIDLIWVGPDQTLPPALTI
jgi:hypothetical protein